MQKVDEAELKCLTIVYNIYLPALCKIQSFLSSTIIILSFTFHHNCLFSHVEQYERRFSSVPSVHMEIQTIGVFELKC